MKRSVEVPDCRTCGACCWSLYEQDVWCDLTAKEVDSFSHQFRSRNVRVYGAFSVLAEGKPPQLCALDGA